MQAVGCWIVQILCKKYGSKKIIWDYQLISILGQLSVVFPKDLCSQILDPVKRDLIMVSPVPLILLHFLVFFPIVIGEKFMKKLNTPSYYSHLVLAILLAVMYGNQKINFTSLHLLTNSYRTTFDYLC